MWDKKGENLTYRWLRLLKEKIDDELTIDDVGKAIDDASSTVGLPVDDPLQQPVDQEEDLIDIILKAKRNVPRCLRGNNITLGSGMGQYSALSDKVKQIQTALGFTGSDVDGKFGPKTFKAAIDFQIKNNLEPDGCVGPETLSTFGLNLSNFGIKRDKPEEPIEDLPSGQAEVEIAEYTGKITPSKIQRSLDKITSIVLHDALTSSLKGMIGYFSKPRTYTTKSGEEKTYYTGTHFFNYSGRQS